jgi:hypothetical protein
MTRKRAKWADQTSFGTPGTTETPGALRSPPVASGEPRRLLSSTPFQSSSGECRIRRRTLGAGKSDTWPPSFRYHVACDRSRKAPIIDGHDNRDSR